MEQHVAPLAGAWIEMIQENEYDEDGEVAPLAGAWIEIIRKRLEI